VGILGQVGSGKTTLVNCLNRYLDVAPGQLFIDERDVTTLSRRDLRSAVRTITQEPFLFSDTVEANIRFGSRGHDDALTLERALYQSDMLDEVNQFPAGENTLVGEKGILMSGGQKQRLSLARGMYTPCKLMILDNVLSAVDNETERFLLDQIFNNMRSQAILIVSHRASVLEQVDQILVLEHGRIVARGTHAQLLASSDIYRRTWELQRHDGGVAR
jgi:ATP-binding cassette subfamily B protein